MEVSMLLGSRTRAQLTTSPRRRWLAGALTAGVLCASAGLAAAQPALDDDDGDGDGPGVAAAGSKKKTHFGAALRLRNVRLPQSLIELFVDDAPSGISQFGVGVELSRRKGNFELQLGLEYDNLNMSDGLWIEKDKPIPANDPDFVEFESFGWVSIEVSFINHTELAPNFFLRYGGGAGLAILTGDVVRTDYTCSSASKDSCNESPVAENQKTPYDLPPVFPIINAIFGVQYRAGGNLALNLEGGLRTVPFVGGSVGYYF
ncbi:MAG: hypothetical protein R2939_16555 [Kofleriaceae bacterium]